jgi:glycosyltransferase involved in cell wall biosynthesis
VVVPAFREEARIAEVVQAAKRYVDTVFVIDDYSPDQTSVRAAEAGAIVLRHEVNRGKGAGLKTAFAKLAELGFTHGITMDGDGQHDAEQLPAFLEALREPGVSMVLGNRFSNPRGMPWVRRLVNASMSWLISRLCRCVIPDSQCGFRGVAVANPAVLAAQSDHYDYETEVLVLTARARGVIRSIPVRTIYRGESSKIRPIRDTWRFFKLLRRI